MRRQFLNSLAKASFFSAVLYLSAATSHAQIISGAPAVDGIGQYDQSSYTDPVFVFDKGLPNDGPNKLGFSNPTGVVVDEVNRRLFVVDTNANRVVVFGLDNQNRPSSRFPQHVLGQPNFASSSSGSGAARLSSPSRAAYWPAQNMLFVADSGNNRVVAYNVASITDGEDAAFVLGQPDFTTTTAAVTATGMSNPVGVAVDSAGSRLFVSMSGGARVLVFDLSSITNGEAATRVLGRADFTSSSDNINPNDQNFSIPAGIAFDATHGRLFVSDPGFSRVLVFDVNVVNNNENATHVFCQSNFTTQTSTSNLAGCDYPSDVAYDGTPDTLFIVDEVNDRVQVFLSAGPGDITNGMSASAILGQLAPPASSPSTSQSRFAEPTGLSVVGSSSTLYVADTANNRVMAFDVAVATTTENAIDMLGQYDEASYSSPVVDYAKNQTSNGANLFGLANSSSMTFDDTRNRLFLADTGNRRVLVYNMGDQGQVLSKVPVAVLGQTNFASRAFGPTEVLTTAPIHSAYDSSTDRLFVSDTTNHRVLVYDASSITNGQAAQFVLGQPDFVSSTSATTQSGLRFPMGLAIDEANQRLFVGDSDNRRVLVFDVASITNGENAVAVLGQANFTSNGPSVSATGMNGATEVAYDSDNQRLFVSDVSAERVLVYDVTSITNGEAAIGVLCQASFTTAIQGTTASTCNDPRGLAYDRDSGTLYLADYSNNRVLAFDATIVTNGEEAVRVLGQTDFTTSTAGRSASKFDLPFMVALNSRARQLYVSEYNNSRVLIFPTRYEFEYSGTSFAESASNIGEIGTVVSVSLTGESFFATSGALTRDVHYTITGVPAGLTEVITITSASTATISFTGAATAHESSNNLSNIVLTFLDPALKNVATASVDGHSTIFSMTFTDTAPCFGAVLGKPKVKVKGNNATVQLPSGVIASATCPITARATSKAVKKPRSRAIRVGKASALFSKLPRGRWTFDYRVTTTQLGSTQTSSSAKATIR